VLEWFFCLCFLHKSVCVPGLSCWKQCFWNTDLFPRPSFLASNRIIHDFVIALRTLFTIWRRSSVTLLLNFPRNREREKIWSLRWELAVRLVNVYRGEATSVNAIKVTVGQVDASPRSQADYTDIMSRQAVNLNTDWIRPDAHVTKAAVSLPIDWPSSLPRVCGIRVLSPNFRSFV
jgi:hypothetical protein